MAQNHKLDYEALGAIKDLMQEKFPELVSLYLKSAETYIHDAENAFKSDNVKALIEAVHPLKASSNNLGATALYNTAEHIEHTANNALETNASIEDLSSSVETLHKEFLNAKRELLLAIEP